jgi:hypothetical protein
MVFDSNKNRLNDKWKLYTRESKENLMHRNGMLIRPNQVYFTKKSKLKFVKKYKKKRVHQTTNLTVKASLRKDCKVTY